MARQTYFKSIRFKLLAIIIAFFAIVSGSLYLTMNFFTNQKIENLEESEAILQLDKVKGLIQYELHLMHSIVGDWAYWDETSSFIANPNQEYIENNLTIDTLENLNIDLMIFLDEDHQLVHSVFYDLEEGIEDIDTTLTDLITEYHFDTYIAEHQEFQGLLQLDNHLMLISSRYILPTDQSGEPLGHLVFVRLFDANELQVIKEIFSFEVKLVDYFELNQTTYQVDLLSSSELIIYGSIETLDQHESILLSLVLPRTNYGMITQVNDIMLYSLIFGAFVLTYILFFLLRKNFTDRIEDMVVSLKNYQAGQKFIFSTKRKAKDEIYMLATETREFINQIEKRNAHIYELAYIDQVTDCANRNQLFERIDQAILESTSPRMLWLLHFDLDYFAHINTLYGYEVGDQYIIKVASILKEIVNGEGLVARLYADQFSILIENTNEEKVKWLAQEMINRINLDIDVLNQKISSHASIGIVSYSAFAQSANEMVQRSYEALVRAEQQGRNQYYIYDENLHQSITRKSLIFNHLKSAIKRNEFHLVYQPQMDLNINEIIGFEALIRWVHPNLGFISPLDFISIAESQGYINDIGAWVLETACRDMKVLYEKIGEEIPFSVNVSGYQFKNKIILSQVDDALSKSNIRPQMLELEITESTFMSWGSEELSILDDLRAKGVVISMDDFGTGYSSLAQIQDIHCDIIKLDSKFVWGIGNPRTEKIIAHVLRLTNELGFTVIAEGVETIAQEAYLKRNHCRLAQGYYYYRPMQFEALLDLMLSKR